MKSDKKNCTTCVFFKSYRDDYNDPEEPDWCGFCSEGCNDGYGDIDYVCNQYKALKEEER